MGAPENTIVHRLPLTVQCDETPDLYVIKNEINIGMRVRMKMKMAR